MSAFGDPTQQGAWDIINQQLDQWGIGDLGDAAKQLIISGLDQNAILIELQNTPQYQTRFSGNAARIKAGLPALSPADYVSTEAAYRQVLSQYGLPSGFYDTQQHLADFIAKDVSPQELDTRAQIAQQTWLSNDQETKDTWRQFYGLSDGAAIASILDPGLATPIVQRMANAAKWGGDASRLGIDANQQRLEQYSDQGYTDAQVQKGLQQVAVEQGTMNKLANRFGQNYNQATAESADIQNDAKAQATRQSLISNEQSLFQSRASADMVSLTRSQGGQF